MATPIVIKPVFVTEVPIGGQSVTILYGPIIGGFLMNPRFAADQGIPAAEVLYVDISGPAASKETVTTVPVQPGGVYLFPANMTTNVSVNAASSKHKFSAVVYQNPPSFPPTPQAGTFPPAGPPISATVPAYLYKEYDDDDGLQYYMQAFNSLAAVYPLWFANTPLAVYTNPAISGSLLDWVSQGIYGMARPALGSNKNRDLGPLNTYRLNQLPLNVRRRVGPINVQITTDDVLKRIITWNFYKGDGFRFSIPWLKRRVMRFLIGAGGSAPNIDQTYAVSVSFSGPSKVVTIRINVGRRFILGGALPNRFRFNQRIPLNSLITRYQSAPSPFPLEQVLKQAIEGGVLLLPFQFSYKVII